MSGTRSSGRPDRPSRPSRPDRPERSRRSRPVGSGVQGSAGRTRPAGRPPAEPVQVDVHDPDGVRLQKLLAAAGFGSRRACERLITEGRVEVDDYPVTELGVRVDPVRQRVAVDGRRVQVDTSRSYLAFNKPRGVVSTMQDEHGRPCISDFVSRRGERVYHVGRLDADTDGLLLLTNDGDLAHHLQHPGFGVLKTYIALVEGPVPRDLGRRLRAGVDLEDGPVAVDSFRMIDSSAGKALVEVIVHEGRTHVVRRLLDAVGHPVISLTRTAVGPVRLGDLPSGKTRPLTHREVSDLFVAAGL